MDLTGSQLRSLHLQRLERFEPRDEKTNVLDSDRVRHKPGCTAAEDG